MNFKEKWYTVTESDGQVSVSLSISGKFFVPVFAIVEVSSMTAKCGSYKCIIIQLMASQNTLAKWDFDASNVLVADCCLHSGVVAY